MYYGPRQLSGAAKTFKSSPILHDYLSLKSSFFLSLMPPARHISEKWWEEIETAIFRGDFQMIDEAKIDLPKAGNNKSAAWTSLVPEPFRCMLLSPNSRLTGNVGSAEWLENSKSFSKAVVHERPGHYHRMLLKATRAEMISWSEVEREDPEWSVVADALTMTSFAVAKDMNRDRLISWPRIQNENFADPPEVDLPDPSLFSRLRISSNSNLSGFALDIENMFHNIRLPEWLVRFFPFKSVRFGNLHADLQRELLAKLRPRYRFRQNSLLRPHQSTLPMGFKWAVYIAHTIADACLHRAMQRFSVIQNSSVNHVKFTRQSRVIHITHGSVLSLHIIDDINCVFSGWKAQDIAKLQTILYDLFEENGLPIKVAKSTPIGILLTETMKFIGWAWNFKTGLITPCLEKLCIADEKLRLIEKSPEIPPPDALEKLVGTLVWFAMGRRPLLSVFRFVFKAIHSLRISDSLANLVRRELSNFRSLLPLAQVSLQRPLWHTVIATDASTMKGAVVFTAPPPEAVTNLLKQSMYHGGMLPDSEPAVKFAESQRWQTAFSHDWRRGAHINLLEAEAIIMAIRWAITRNARNCRIVLLSDSHVAVAAFAKGRSTSPPVLRQTRRFAALCLAHDIEVAFVHISSKSNPADAPSRQVELC